MAGHAYPLDKFKLIRFTFVLILLAYGKSGFTETMVTVSYTHLTLPTKRIV